MSDNNSTYDLSGYMSREQIDNIANNMWRIENKRNSMIEYCNVELKNHKG